MKLIITIMTLILLCACGSSSPTKQVDNEQDSTEKVIVEKIQVTTIADSLLIK